MAEGPPFYEDPPLLTAPFASNLTTAHSVVLFLWLNGRLRHISYATFLNDIMDVQMLSFKILMHVLCNKVSSLLRSDTWCSFLLVLWFDITHTQKTQTHTQRHTTHSQASRPTHPFKYTFTPTVMCSQQLSLLHWMNNSVTSKTYFPQCFFFSKIIHLQKSCWLDAIRLDSSCETFFKITPYFIKPPPFMKKIWIYLNTPPFSKMLKIQTSLFIKGRLQLWYNTQDNQKQWNFQNQNDALIPSFLRHCCSNCRYWLLQSD